jgi:ribosome-associated protein
MSAETALTVNAALSIPRTELEYRATRAGGPGGQHVNTSSTRIELYWNVRTSAALSEDQRQTLLAKLAGRLDADGYLRLVSAARRSQHQNKEEADRRLAALLLRALHVPRPRKRTRVPRAVKEARLRDKKQRGEVKRQRGRPTREE